MSKGLRDSEQRPLVANNIALLRARRKLSQKALADLVGTTQQEIGRLENGERKLTWDWMAKLSDALRCHPMDLVNWP